MSSNLNLELDQVIAKHKKTSRAKTLANKKRSTGPAPARKNNNNNNRPKVHKTAQKSTSPKKPDLINPEKIKIQISNNSRSSSRSSSLPSIRSAPKKSLSLSSVNSPKKTLTKKPSRIVEVVKSRPATSGRTGGRSTLSRTSGGRRITSSNSSSSSSSRTLTLNDRFSRR